MTSGQEMERVYSYNPKAGLPATGLEYQKQMWPSQHICTLASTETLSFYHLQVTTE